VSATPAITQNFDFLFGSWKIHNRYLKGRLEGSTDWIEFEATSTVEPLLQGLGNIERYSARRDGKPMEGMTLRLFNPSSGEWSLYWADTNYPGILQPPIVGKFHDGVGEFLGDEEVNGRKVLCRFIWRVDHHGSPRWEQAFSDDGGKSWELNWVMTFTRDIRQ
jgi:hypothetical protein